MRRDVSTSLDGTKMFSSLLRVLEARRAGRFRRARLHQAQRCLTRTDIGQTAFQQQLHRMINRYPRDSGGAVDPAVGIEIGVLRRPQFGETGSWFYQES